MKRLITLLTIANFLALSLFASDVSEKKEIKGMGIPLIDASEQIMMKTSSLGYDLDEADYIMNFELTDTADFFNTWFYLNANEDDKYWEWYSDDGIDDSYNMGYPYNSSSAADDWLFSRGMYLTSGNSYSISFYYCTEYSSFPEKFDLYYGTDNSKVMTTLIRDFGTVNNTNYTKTTDTISVETSDDYYFGWHCYSDADMGYLKIDSVVIKKVDSDGSTGGETPTTGEATWTSYATTNTGSNGIVNNDVNAYLEASNGDKWYGTDKGLSKYDGSSWQTLSQADGLGRDNVTCLFEDMSGNIWIGSSYGGVSKYDGTTITKYTEYSGLPNSSIKCVTQESDSTIWVGTIGGVAYFNGSSFTEIYGFPNYSGYALCFDNAGLLWVGGSAGVSTYDGTTVSTILTTTEGLPSNYVNAIKQDASGNMWLGTGSGLVKYDGSTITKYGTDEGALSTGIRNIAIDNNGHLWMNASYAGIQKYDGTSFTIFTETDGLVSNNTNNIYADNSNNIHICTNSGVSIYNGSSFTTLSTKDGLIGNSISNISQGALGKMLISTYDGLSLFDDEIWNFEDVSGNLPDNSVYGSLEAANGNLWIATYRGAVKYDGFTWTLYDDDNGLLNSYVKGITEDASGNIWLATDGGASRISSSGITNFTTTDGMVSNYSKNIACKGNDIYVGSGGYGVSYYNGSVWTTLTEADGLVDNSIGAIYIANDGKVWIGTDYDGIAIYDGTVFDTIGIADGLHNDNINAITADADNNIWVATENGAEMFDGTEWIVYNADSGLINNYTTSLYCDDNGALWIGTLKGISVYTKGSGGETPPTIDAIFEATTATSGTTPLEVTFSSTSTGSITNYTWDFGDGTNESSFMGVTNHTYTTAGTYDVKLVVSDGTLKDSMIINNYVTVLPVGTNGTETENNDTYGVANTISLNASMTGEIGYTSNDMTDNYDWYKITIPYDGALMFDVSTESTLNTDIFLYGSDGSYYHGGCNTCGGDGAVDTLVRYNLKADTYYLQMGCYGFGSYTLSNTFTPTLLPLGNDAEDNDTYENANDIVIGESKTGHLGYHNLDGTDNYDWYKVTIPYDGALMFEVSPESTLNTNIFLYGSDGSYYHGGCNTCGGDGAVDTLVRYNLKADTYYLQMGCYGFGSYTLSNTFTPTLLPLGNDAENNDTFENAILLSVGESKTGHIGYTNLDGTDNYDWYVFTVSQADKYSVIISPDDMLNTDPSLYQTNGNTYLGGFNKTGGDGENDTLFEKELSVGTYYIKISAYGYGSYTISLENSQQTPTLTANFTMSGGLNTAPYTVQFTDASTGNPTSWKWDFDNDETIDSELQNPSYTYTTAGTYSVKLTVSVGIDSDSELKSDYVVVTAGSSTLSAAFSADKTSGEAPLTVQFTDASANATSWQWDFDNDGTVDSELQSPSYTYTNAGTYSVKLTVSDGTNSDFELKSDYVMVSDGTTPTEAIISTTTGGDWNKTTTWIGGVIPTSTDNVVINGYVYLNRDFECNNLTINEGCTLSKSDDKTTRTLIVEGHFVNNGIVMKPETILYAYTFDINVSGNVTNTGTINDVYVCFAGSTDQFISTTTNSIWKEGYILDTDSSSAIIAASNLYFHEGQSISLRDDNDRFGSIILPKDAGFNIYGNGSVTFSSINIVGNGNEINLTNKAQFWSDARLIDIRVTGNAVINTGTNFIDNVINIDTISNESNLSRYLSTYGTFTNKGVVLGATEYKTVRALIYGDLINEGSWKNCRVDITGVVDQTITLNNNSTIGSTVRLFANVGGALTYQWKKDGVDIDFETGYMLELDSLYAANVGVYTCESSNGNSRNIYLGVSSSASLNTISYVDVILSPNPATTQLTIETARAVMDGISIYDLKGVEVLNRCAVDSHKERLDISFLNSGIYMVKVMSGNSISIEKLIIK